MLNPHLFLEPLRVNGELKNGALSLSRSQFNLLKIVIFGNMTIWIWQLFWKFNKYDNLQYDNYFEHMKIWQFAIWQLFRKNCHIWISKYDNKKKPMAPPPAGPSPRLNFQDPPPAGPCRRHPGYSDTGLKHFVIDKLIFNLGILIEIPKYAEDVRKKKANP